MKVVSGVFNMVFDTSAKSGTTVQQSLPSYKIPFLYSIGWCTIKKIRDLSKRKVGPLISSLSADNSEEMRDVRLFDLNVWQNDVYDTLECGYLSAKSYVALYIVVYWQRCMPYQT